MVAAIDFDSKTFTSSEQECAFIAWDNNMTTAKSHFHTIVTDISNRMFLILDISFYQEVNDQKYKLRDGSFIRVGIVGVGG